jgi:hypothetical protein
MKLKDIPQKKEIKRFPDSFKTISPILELIGGMDVSITEGLETIEEKKKRS